MVGNRDCNTQRGSIDSLYIALGVKVTWSQTKVFSLWFYPQRMFNFKFEKLSNFDFCAIFWGLTKLKIFFKIKSFLAPLQGNNNFVAILCQHLRKDWMTSCVYELITFIQTYFYLFMLMENAHFIQWCFDEILFYLGKGKCYLICFIPK